MFGHLKHVVHSNSLDTIEELQMAAVNAMNEITSRQLTNIINNIKPRINLCLEKY